MNYSQLEKLGGRYPKRINNKLVKLKFANNPSIWILDLFLNGTIFLLLILIQGVLIENCQTEIGLALKWYMSDPML